MHAIKRDVLGNEDLKGVGGREYLAAWLDLVSHGAELLGQLRKAVGDVELVAPTDTRQAAESLYQMCLEMIQDTMVARDSKLPDDERRQLVVRHSLALETFRDKARRDLGPAVLGEDGAADRR